MPRHRRVFARLATYATGTITGALIGSAALLQPVLHEAQMSFLISPVPSTTAGESDLASRAYLSQNRAGTYAQVMTSRQVLGPVIDMVGLDANVSTLAETVDVVIPYDTSILSVTVTNRDPELATEIAASIAQRAPEALQDLDREDREAPARVNFVPLGEPQLLEPTHRSVLWMGPLLGGVTGLAVASRLWRHVRLRQRSQSIEDVQSVLTGLPVLGYLANGPRAEVGVAIRQRLARLTGPLAVVGTTSQVDAQGVAVLLGSSVWEPGRSAVLDLGESDLDGPTLRAKMPVLLDELEVTLLTGPSLPGWSNPDAMLLPASAAILIVPSRDAWVNELLRTFDILTRAKVPIIGAIIVDHTHASDSLAQGSL